jgi:hypothetical protein
VVTRTHLAFVVALAACTTSPTRVELAVTADPGWAIDHYELRIGDHAVGAMPLSTLELQLPDDMAGHSKITPRSVSFRRSRSVSGPLSCPLAVQRSSDTISGPLLRLRRGSVR